MAEIVIPKRKARTQSDHKQLLANHILPALGKSHSRRDRP